MKQLGIVFALLLALASPAVAQTDGGSITGSVRDQQGAAVPGSDVSVQGSDATFRFTTGLDGAFRFLNLEPGTYHLTASLSGFRTVERDLIGAVGRNVDAPIELRIASLAESVTVVAPAPMLDATAKGTATTFAKAELADIPSSRDPLPTNHSAKRRRSSPKIRGNAC